MLVCFGLSWPISIAKAVRTKNVDGKSSLFIGIIIAGYISGILHKIFYAMDWVVVLYAINLVLVGIDGMLYFRYRKPVPS
jgi:hypothetical protein